MSTDPVVIVGLARTPMGAFQGAFSSVTAPQLGSAAIKAAMDEAKVSPADVDQVLMGCVLPAGQGQAPARQAALGADLPLSAEATTINKMCGSGMQAAIMAHDALKAGSINVAVAGGMESMTNAPYILPKARGGMRMGNQQVVDTMMHDGLTDAYDNKAMGVFADQIASEYQFTREQQDAYAIESVRRAQSAETEGKFDREMTAVTVKGRKGDTVVTKDEGPSNARPEKIPSLRPVFNKEGTVTAANASSINDGAAALVLMRRSDAEKGGHKVLAEIVSHAAHAHEPSRFTTAPVNAINKALGKAGWSAEDVDLWEINEAFAVVPMIAMQELGLDHAKVNVNGGGCVLGHPIGASGARIMATLIAEMEKRDAKTGVASLCIGGGEATAVCLKRD
ncbi:acetyl-CoA acetyltransferase [Litorimonas cladophorae]|uniref:Acetyl-CoA acetyltransferase n=1 Tax=Litorimonas cladophorae TaxID=1220491 RepID=A0A918NGM6_9PROT|nr:acetyl-CoA C-acyltransferase [Litorimonas cladophorae]GGX71658.1 acetyl-CoA acetyltransferase [Litorimonas cladophorae]